MYDEEDDDLEKANPARIRDAVLAKYLKRKHAREGQYPRMPAPRDLSGGSDPGYRPTPGAPTEADFDKEAAAQDAENQMLLEDTRPEPTHPAGMPPPIQLPDHGPGPQEDYAQKAAAMGRAANAGELGSRPPAAMRAPSAATAAKGLRNAPSAPATLKIGEPTITPLPPQAQPEEDVGLEMTPDRHASLMDGDEKIDQPQDPQQAQEAPQNTSDLPEAQVDNKKLAAAVNATSATTSKADVAQAMQRPRAPQNKAAYYAALKDIATAFQGADAFGKMDLGGGYYDAKMAEEQQKGKDYQGELKDWRAKVAADLKQRFDAAEKEKDRALTSKRDEALAAHYKNLEGNVAADNTRADRQLTETERHNRAMEARKPGGGITIDLNGHAPLTPAQEETGMRNAEKHVIPEGVISGYNDVMDRLNDPTPIAGMDAGAAAEQGMGATFGKAPFIGDAMSEGVGDMFRSEEANNLIHRLDQIKDAIRVKTTGMAATDKERADLRKRLGITRGDSEFRLAVKQEMENEFENYRKWFEAQHPQIQQRLMEAGEGPPAMHKAMFGRKALGSQASTWDVLKPGGTLDQKVGGWLKSKFGGGDEARAPSSAPPAAMKAPPKKSTFDEAYIDDTETDPVKHAKRMQEDPEYRRKHTPK